MKGLNLININAGLEKVTELANENSGIGHEEILPVMKIEFAKKNTYASEDTNDSIQDLADQIKAVGLLKPLGVVRDGERYILFDGERRLRAIRELGWETVACRVFEGVSDNKKELMLHIANGSRGYSPELRFELYEEYEALLSKMKENGEFKGGIQKGVAELLYVSPRQVRNYRLMSEQLNAEEKQRIHDGELSFGDALELAKGRVEKKAEPVPLFEPEDEPDQEGKPLCKTGLSPYGICGAAANCEEPHECCASCDLDCNIRCGWLAADEDEQSGTVSAFEPSADGPTEEDDDEKITDQTEPIPEDNLNEVEREKLLTAYIPFIYDVKDLKSYYASEWPTPSEATKAVLKPRNGYQSGHHPGSVTYDFVCRNDGLTVRTLTGKRMNVRYKYHEVDEVIRQMFRDGILTTKKGVTIA